MFYYEKNVVPSSFFEPLLKELQDKCLNATLRRKSCIFFLSDLFYNHQDTNLDSSFHGSAIENYKNPQFAEDYGIDGYTEVPDLIKQIQKIVEEKSSRRYDYVLAHIYLNGEASISWHCDKESIGNNTTICSVSLGATRKFRLKNKLRKTGYDAEYHLESGDMLLMLPGSQEKYVHCIPVEKRVKEPRINLTFRQFGFK